MANFVYNWQDGVTTSLNLPTDDTWACANISPHARWTSIGGDIIGHAGDSTDQMDVKNYCIQGLSAIGGLIEKSEAIRNTWDSLEIDCANWNNWFRRCKDKARYCSLSEGALASAYWSWQPIPLSLLSSRATLEIKLADTLEMLNWDLSYATELAIVQQMIAETNNLISLTAYQNDIRELTVTKKKTQDVFTPILLVLILLGLGFYLYKK